VHKPKPHHAAHIPHKPHAACQTASHKPQDTNSIVNQRKLHLHKLHAPSADMVEVRVPLGVATPQALTTTCGGINMYMYVYSSHLQ